LRAVLGETFGGVIGCDYFAAYHKYMADSGAAVQFCMAHLIRDIRFLPEQANASVTRWGKRLLGWMRKLLQPADSPRLPADSWRLCHSASPSAVAHRRRESGYRVSESLPELKPFIQ